MLERDLPIEREAGAVHRSGSIAEPENEIISPARQAPLGQTDIYGTGAPFATSTIAEANAALPSGSVTLTRAS